MQASFVAAVEEVGEKWTPSTAKELPSEYVQLVEVPLFPLPLVQGKRTAQMLEERLKMCMESEEPETALVFFEYIDAYIVAARALAKYTEALTDKETSGDERQALAELIFEIPAPSTVQLAYFVLEELEVGLVQVDWHRTLISLKGAGKLLRRRAGSTKAARRSFSQLWLAFLRLPLSTQLTARTVQRMRMIEVLGDAVMGELAEPALLSDFFLSVFEKPYPLNVAALRGLTTLITKHDLNYSELYKAVYGVLTPGAMQGPGARELLSLLALFLASTHLPAYTVAAFVKRLARIALYAPPHIAAWILQALRNLLVRHKALKPMVDRTAALGEATSDPYVADEEDPAKCLALDSALWEVKTLRSHWCPDVSSRATWISDTSALFDEPPVFPDFEEDFYQLSSMDSYSDTHSVPINNRPLSHLFSSPIPCLSWS